MGCVGSRYGAAESTLLSKSQKTRFELSFPEAIIEAIRRYVLDSSGTVNEKQLGKIQDKLMLRTGEGLKEFYQRAKKMQDLMIAGVLLSMGSPSEKAAALFEIRDEFSLNSLSPSEVDQLVQTLYTVCLDILPLLSPLDEDDLKYLNRVRGMVDKAVPAYRDIAMGKADKVDRSTFASNIEAYMEGKLTDPSGIREFASSIEKTKDAP